jgi:hypothetical protein
MEARHDGCTYGGLNRHTHVTMLLAGGVHIYCTACTLDFVTRALAAYWVTTTDVPIRYLN